jgi:hypothetical protein
MHLRRREPLGRRLDEVAGHVAYRDAVVAEPAQLGRDRGGRGEGEQDVGRGAVTDRDAEVEQVVQRDRRRVPELAEAGRTGGGDATGPHRERCGDVELAPLDALQRGDRERHLDQRCDRELHVGVDPELVAGVEIAHQERATQARVVQRVPGLAQDAGHALHDVAPPSSVAPRQRPIVAGGRARIRLASSRSPAAMS